MFFQEAMPEEGSVPGAVVAIQSFGDFLGFNPHLHILGTDGCFYGKGMFRPALARLIGLEADNPIFGSLNDTLLMSRITRSGPGLSPRFEPQELEEIFRHKVFKMLLSKGKITGDLVDMLMSWRHSGFNVFCGPRIQPGDEGVMENLARYIIRASFSQKRMNSVPEESKVIYQSKDGKQEKAFDALEWLAAMCSHVPNKGEQMVRYYGFYSNVSRGKRKSRIRTE